MQKRIKNELSPLITVMIGSAAVLTLIYLLLLPGSIFVRFGLAIIILAVSGHMIATANGLKNSFGAYLLGSKRGIKFVENVSRKNQRLWILFSDWGIALSFGLLSYFFFRKQMDRRMFVLGMATIIVVVVVVYPYLPVVLSFISIPQITSRVSVAPAQGVTPLFYAFLALSVLGGFSVSTAFLIIYGAATILLSTITFVIGFVSSTPNYSILTQQIPGVAPLIPGITIPLFAGVISLAILLVVHEFSHGILARIAKVRIKSIGVVLFGVIPMGAFVEPDEKQIKKLNIEKQDRIFIAGVSANMLTCLFFFIFVFILLSYILPNLDTGGVLVTGVVPGYPANGVVTANSTILMWNVINIRNQFDLARVEASYIPGNSVVLTTSQGSFVLTPTSAGKLGVSTAPAAMSASYQAINFLYAVAALSFGLNFFVAIFNLLPIPGFDGWQIYQNKIKSKKVLKIIAGLMIASILLNVLPWLWSVS